MRSHHLLLASLVTVAACAHRAAPSPMANVPADVQAPPADVPHPAGEPAGFLFVDNFDYDEPGLFSGRPYAISLNVAIPGHDQLRAALAWRLADAGVVEQVAVEPFGEDPPDHIEIHVGDHVPVAVVQAILDVYGRQRAVPLRVGLSVVDSDFGNRARVYVGSLVDAVPSDLTAAQLAALLAPTLTADQLRRLLPTLPEN